MTEAQREQALGSAQQCNNDLKAFTDYERRLRDACQIQNQVSTLERIRDPDR